MIETYVQNMQKAFNGFVPEVLIILGSGLGVLADRISDKIIVPYTQIGFPKIMVSGHKGELIAGYLGGRKVLCMNGRYHLYEGHPASLAKDMMSAFQKIGIKEVIATNAAGSLRADMPAGALMMITDHINFSGQNPLIGANNDREGPRFPDMSNDYDHDLQEKIRQTAKENNIRLYEGTYFFVVGPNFETKAEVRAFRLLGADAVGMSTVPEVISAIYFGMKVVGISVITNQSADIQPLPLSHEETLMEAHMAAVDLQGLLIKYLEK
ncbi:MAG TPA: purine-nucleoside phosphorylase [Alphaproteobacteria bacterium]|nr:purine-nucleoside phosphorylase [Alphaproteobacteria bacterium]